MGNSNALVVTGILLDLLAAAAEVSELLNRVQLENRDISDEELATIEQNRANAWARFDAPAGTPPAAA